MWTLRPSREDSIRPSRLRTDEPGLSSLELSAQLNARLSLKHPLSEAGLRKVLQRARDLFAGCGMRPALDETKALVTTATPLSS